MMWVKLTLPPRARRRWLLITTRLSAMSLAGTARTLVAVGTLSDACMFATTRAAAPRRGVGTGVLGGLVRLRRSPASSAARRASVRVGAAVGLVPPAGAGAPCGSAGAAGFVSGFATAFGASCLAGSSAAAASSLAAVSGVTGAECPFDAPGCPGPGR